LFSTQVPNAFYRLSSATEGPADCGAVTLAINKQFGYAQCGVLIPNTYFGYGNLSVWARDNAKAAARAVAWPERTAAALYRGSLSPAAWPEPKDCGDAFGNHARLAAFAAARAAPDAVDAKCVGAGHYSQSCAVPPPPAGCAGAVADFNAGLATNATDIEGGHVDEADYERARYVLNLPGAASGSYSRALNHLWRTGAVVLQWAAPFVEWYYPALTDYETHVVVAQRSVAATVRALEADRASAEALGRAGRAIHDTFLCPECLAKFLARAIGAARDHLGMGLVLDDPAAAAAFFRAELPCDALVEVVRGGHHYASRPVAADDPRHPCRDRPRAVAAAAPAADADRAARLAAKRRSQKAHKRHKAAGAPGG